ncbi:MAG: ribonuclease Y [Sulfurovum sp.]|nr:ribonuclease Y [Sulfurovum sp.]
MYMLTGISLLIGIGVGYLLSRVGGNKRFRYFKLEAQAKAKTIEQEASLMLEKAKVEIQEKELKQKKELDKLKTELEKRNRDLMLKSRETDSEKEKTLQLQNQITEREKNLQILEEKKRQEIDKTIYVLENIASLTENEAKAYILQKVEEKSQADIVAIVRKHEKLAHEEAKKKANYILAQATTRYAGEFAGERLINVVNLPSDEHKGRIIGKEGRNIKTMEQLLGVDIIVDETPGVILVSNFNLYRRAIATRVIEILVEDGRIHPGRIEEVHKKVQAEFEQKIYEDGENVVIDLGLFPMHEELIKLLGRLKYRASYGQNALAHTLEVARLARVLAAEMGGDEKLAMRAGLLHDIGKALTQDFGGSHVELGAEVCKRHNEHPTVINAIYAHHGHEEFDSVESAAVCIADTLSAARPGARREVLESFTKRVKDIEALAMENEGVIQAYAINAGREIRVFVDAGKIDDNKAAIISSSLAKKIEDKIQYPGEIKVNVIRETRSVNFAK